MEHLFWGSNISAKIIVAKDQSNHTVGVINGEEFLAECACCALKSPYRSWTQQDLYTCSTLSLHNTLNQKYPKTAVCFLLRKRGLEALGDIWYPHPTHVYIHTWHTHAHTTHADVYTRVRGTTKRENTHTHTCHVAHTHTYARAEDLFFRPDIPTGATRSAQPTWNSHVLFPYLPKNDPQTRLWTAMYQPTQYFLKNNLCISNSFNVDLIR